jgi:hypothetical protein
MEIPDSVYDTYSRSFVTGIPGKPGQFWANCSLLFHPPVIWSLSVSPEEKSETITEAVGMGKAERVSPSLTPQQ